MDLKIMSARLGHASVSITADVYQQVIDGMDEDAARCIGALVFPHQADSGVTVTRLSLCQPVALGRSSITATEGRWSRVVDRPRNEG